MLPPTQSKIKPAYPHLVKYSKLDDPLQTLPDSQHLNESVFADDVPPRQINLEENIKWGRELRQAAETK